jgi:2-dehydro-3-deoxy-D-gluconate 5-dehydrogenase
MEAQITRLKDKVAIVTGSAQGIGRALAIRLASEGAKVAVADIDIEGASRTADEIKKSGASAIAVKLDVSRLQDAIDGADRVERELGPIDILVNNAGIALPGGVLKVDAAAWDRVIETNLNSCFLLSQIAARSMAPRRRGKIVNIASEYSHFGNPILPSYAASKGGLVQLTKSMAVELAAHNIQVNALVPGWIESELTAPMKGRPFYDEVVKRTPAGRFGMPEECAGAAVFLASRASDFVTGATVVVDGGYAVR